METIDELVPFLNRNTRLDLKAVSLGHILGLTGTRNGILLICDCLDLLRCLMDLTQDNAETIRKDAVLSLVNISAEEHGAKCILKLFPHIVTTAYNEILDENSKYSDAWTMMLSNISRPESLVEQVLDKLLKIEHVIDKLVSCFTIIDYNKNKGNLNYLGPLFSNLCQSDRGRAKFCDKSNLLSRILPFIQHDSIIRRGGAAGLLKNICFDTSIHDWLLSEDVGVLPYILLPLTGMSRPQDNVFMKRSEGISAEGVQDQYADGKAAKVWTIFIGDKRSRTENYKNFLVDMLRKNGCRRILDVACGTGVDSILLVEEGFEVVSIDASDKMLKYALRERWDRRKEASFDKWIIEEANWLTLYNDIYDLIGDGFDAVICLGNSFAHMLDNYGDQREQIQAIRNFERCVKPGGLLLIDHRNYDNIMDTGSTPAKSIYYNSSHMTDIKTSVLYVASKPALVTLDYMINTGLEVNEFRLSYYPHLLKVFTEILAGIFKQAPYYEIFGDFKKLNAKEIPSFYIHVIQKGK